MEGLIPASPHGDIEPRNAGIEMVELGRLLLESESPNEVCNALLLGFGWIEIDGCSGGLRSHQSAARQKQK